MSELAKTYKVQYEEVDEDERAQIATIFKHFDPVNTRRLDIETLPVVLRLLGKNIGNHESQDLMVTIDKNARGFYTYSELVDLLADHQFKEDEQIDMH
jgi:Ca2+-binding EF-hand superfamily protein